MSFDQQTSIASLQQSGQLLGQPLKTTDAWFSLSQKLEGDWPAWRGESLTRELLESVGQSWSSLDVNLKAKLLMALVALKKSVATQLEDQIRNLFDLALQVRIFVDSILFSLARIRPIGCGSLPNSFRAFWRGKWTLTSTNIPTRSWPIQSSTCAAFSMVCLKVHCLEWIFWRFFAHE